MLPVNQQNLAFLTISSDNSIENNTLGVDDGSLLGFGDLFSAYVTPLESENVAALDYPDLPLSAILNEQIPAENTTASVVSSTFLPSTPVLLSAITSSVAENNSIENTSLPSVLQIKATGEPVTFSDESVPYENNLNSYASPVLTLSTNTHHSNDIDIATNNQSLQLSRVIPANIDLADTNISTSPNIQQDSKVGQLKEDSTSQPLNQTLNQPLNQTLNQPLNQTLNNSLSSLSASVPPAATDASSEQVNITEETHGRDNQVEQKYDSEVQLFINQQNVVSSATPIKEPEVINIPSNAYVATQNTKVSLPQNTRINHLGVTQPATQIESDNFTNQSEKAQPILANQQQTQAQSSANNFFNNTTQISSIDIAADKQAFSPSSLEDNIDGAIEQKTVTTSNLATLVDVNSQQTQNQTLLNINKATPVASAPADLSNVSDITNSNEIAKQLVLAQQNGTQQIRLLITPEHLGAVDISIQDAKEGVNIQIVTHNLATKESLEAFMPRLREMLEQSGVNIQGTSVEHKHQNNDSSFGADYQQANQENDDKIDQHDGNDIQDQSHITKDIPLSDHILDAFA